MFSVSQMLPGKLTSKFVVAKMLTVTWGSWECLVWIKVVTQNISRKALQLFHCGCTFHGLFERNQHDKTPFYKARLLCCIAFVKGLQWNKFVLDCIRRTKAYKNMRDLIHSDTHNKYACLTIHVCLLVLSSFCKTRCLVLVWRSEHSFSRFLQRERQAVAVIALLHFLSRNPTVWFFFIFWSKQTENYTKTWRLFSIVALAMKWKVSN